MIAGKEPSCFLGKNTGREGLTSAVLRELLIIITFSRLIMRSSKVMGQGRVIKPLPLMPRVVVTSAGSSAHLDSELNHYLIHFMKHGGSENPFVV